jgi:DNA-binding response OmpR family regulator
LFGPPRRRRLDVGMSGNGETGDDAGRTVLVVDDDGDVRGALVAVLEVEGYHAVGLPSANEALAALRRRELRPSLILLDLMMPGMTGWDFRTEQLQDDELAEIPVIVMSGWSSTLDAVQKGALRAATALVKPVDPERLVAEVARHVRHEAAAH